jgi:uncharacterized protein HemX
MSETPLTEIDRERLKRAVKEALDDKAIEDLSKQMTALSAQMTESFARVETRQDTANGKLMKHENQIATLQKSEDAINRRTTFWQRNQDKLIWGFIGVGLLLFYFLLTNAGFPHFLAK